MSEPIEFEEETPGVWKAAPGSEAALDNAINGALASLGTSLDEMRQDVPPAGTVCEWYALCDHLATMFVKHPIIGLVPTCDRCAEKHGLQSA